MNDPFDFFDRIYCINLDRRTDRWERVSAELARLGLARRVERVPAVEAEDGARGCRDSHVECVRRAMASGAETALILEDDVTFVTDPRPPLARALAELATVGGWDAFYLGAEAMGPPFERLPHIYRGRVVQTHAIALHRRAFGRTLHAGVPVDCWYAMAMRAWVMYPPVATQIVDRSDISPGVVDRSEAMRHTLRLHLELSPHARRLLMVLDALRRRLTRTVTTVTARLGHPRT